jgi:DNA-binding transcriptional MerR regulator
MLLKVGELAKRSGLTVRTLHHYDAIGLLRPSARSEAGYRLYDRSDVARLHQIQALRRFGLALAEIGACLAGAGAPLAPLIERQIHALDAQIDQAAQLRGRLVRLHASLRDGAQPELGDWLTTLEMMTMYDRYFSSEELNRLPLSQLDPTRETAWAALVAEVGALRAAGVPAEHEDVQALSRRWMTMLKADTNGDPRLLAKLNLMHDRESAVQRQTGISPDLLAYVLRAFSESRLVIYAKYLTPDELRFTRAHFGQHMFEWPQLIGEVRDALDQGVSPESPVARALAARWQAMFRAFAGDDPVTQRKFRDAHQHEPDLMTGSWADEAVVAFIRAASEAAG